MSAKRILIFSYEFYPKIGGISSYVEELLKGFKSIDTEVVLLSWAYRSRFLPYDHDRKIIEDSPIKIKRIFNIFHYYFGFWQFFFFNKKSLESYDAILLADTTAVKFAMYFFEADLRKKTTIIFHGGELQSFYHNVQGFKRKLRFKQKFIQLLRDIKGIITVSEYHRNQFVTEFPSLSTKIVKIYHGINSSDFTSSDKNKKLNLRKHLHLNADDLVLISASRLIFNKGQDSLIKFFSRLLKLKPSCTLLIAGDGPEKINLVKLVGSLNLSAKIKFTDGLSRIELIKYLNASDIFVQLSSLPETFGMVYIEAALSSLPVIGINIGGVSEAIEDEKSGFLINQDDYDGFRNAVFKIIQDEENLIGQYSRERAIKIFNNERMAKETFDYLIR